MKKFLAASLLAAVSSTASFAEVAPSVGVVTEFTRKSSPANTTNLDVAWIRLEPKLKGTMESGVTGLLHVRMQANYGETGGLTTKAGKVEKAQLNIWMRQAYFSIPVSVLTIKTGRWYEAYTPGKYFGRYLIESSLTDGTGSNYTNYTVIDGFDLSTKIDAAKLAIKLGLLPQGSSFENLRLRALLASEPVEGLNVQLGGNFNIYNGTADELEEQRLSLTAAYTILKNLGLGVYAEYGIRDLSDVAGNSWIMAGIDLPTAQFLDLCRFETEFKNYKQEDVDNSADNANFSWMILLEKKVKKVAFGFNFGSDPKWLGSKTASDVGAILRVTAGF